MANVDIHTLEYSLQTMLLSETYSLFLPARAFRVCQKQIEFAHLKTQLRIHSGLNLTNKMKFISHHFSLKNNERLSKKRVISYRLFIIKPKFIKFRT